MGSINTCVFAVWNLEESWTGSPCLPFTLTHCFMSYWKNLVTYKLKIYSWYRIEAEHDQQWADTFVYVHCMHFWLSKTFDCSACIFLFEKHTFINDTSLVILKRLKQLLGWTPQYILKVAALSPDDSKYQVLNTVIQHLRHGSQTNKTLWIWGCVKNPWVSLAYGQLTMQVDQVTDYFF